MRAASDETRRLRHWLLGRLSEEERVQLEERLFTEDGFAEAVRAAEHDLLDEHAAGRLDVAESTAVEQLLLEGDRAHPSLRFARALRTLAAEAATHGTTTAQAMAQGEPSGPTVTQRRRSRWLLPSGGALLAAGIAAVLFWPRDPLERSVAGASGPRSPSRSAADSTPSAPAGMPHTLTLLAERTRSVDARRRVELPAGASQITMQLEVPEAPHGARRAGDDASVGTWRVEVLDARGRSVYDSPPLMPRTIGIYSAVETTLPASVLRAEGNSSSERLIQLHRLADADASAPAFEWRIEIASR